MKEGDIVVCISNQMKKNKKDGQRDFAMGDLVDYKIYTQEEGLHRQYNPFTVEDSLYSMGYMVYTIASKDGIKRFDVLKYEITLAREQIRDDKLKELGI